MTWNLLLEHLLNTGGVLQVPEDLWSPGTGRYGREKAAGLSAPTEGPGLSEWQETSCYGTLHGVSAED